MSEIMKLDVMATDILNCKYKDTDSVASIHTYANGMQEINTRHGNGTHGLFVNDYATLNINNKMDCEILQYFKDVNRQ